MIELIDIGVNLTHNSLLSDLDAVMQRAAAAGVQRMAVTGTTIESSREAVELCRRYPERLVSTCGVHPHHAGDWNRDSRDALAELAQQPRVRAIGETGLDFNRNYSPREAQEYAFRQQMELAAELRMPLFCHQRDAHPRFVELLREYRERLDRVVLHCFTDTRAALLDYLGLDCYIGVTGWICDERRGVELQQLVRLIPDERLLLETDAPYLLPRDLNPKPPNRINEPAYLPHILERVAHHRQQPAAAVAAQCVENSRRFFDL